MLGMDIFENTLNTISISMMKLIIQTYKGHGINSINRKEACIKYIIRLVDKRRQYNNDWEYSLVKTTTKKLQVGV